MLQLLTSFASAAQHTAKVAEQSTSNLTVTGKDMIAAQANDVASAGIFPLDVALVTLGCLVVSGLVLLLRESRIERSAQHQG